MRVLTEGWRRLRSLWRRADLERGLDTELQFHIEQQAEKNLRAGMSQDEAHRQALLAFGGVALARERTRDQFGTAAFEHALRDVRHGARALLRAPGVTAGATLMFALGIGATTLVFSIVESVLLRPFPYPDPDRIVLVQGSRSSESAADLADYRAQSTTIAALGAYSRVQMRSPDSEAPVRTVGVTSDVFRVLGVPPSLGPGFPPDEPPPGRSLTGTELSAAIRGLGPNVVLLGHGYWQRHYGADAGVVGRTIRLDGTPHEIVGVMPRGFFFPEADVELWTPLGGLTVGGYLAVARLEPDARLSTVQAELDVISGRLDEVHPLSASGGAERRAVTVVPIREAAVSRFQTVLWLLLGAVTLVLLIACANVANLLLARSVARGKELAVRATLGASRAVLLRELIVESLGLSVVGGLVGVLCAVGGLRVVLGLGLVDIPRMDAATINVPVFLFTAAVSICTGLLAGVVPAWKASPVNLTGALKQGGHTSSQAGSSRLRDALVVAEVALAVLLLVSAGLLVRSAVAMSRIDWGFAPRGVSIVSGTPLSLDTVENRIVLAAALRESHEGRVRRTDAVLERLRARPDVFVAGAASSAPFAPGALSLGERLVADGASLDTAVTANRIIVTPGYLQALGVELRGRAFEVGDDAEAPKVVVISRSLANALFPGRDPIGQIVYFAALRESAVAALDLFSRRVNIALAQGGSENIHDFQLAGAAAHTVIGVAADVRLTGDLSIDAGDPVVYVDYRQFREQVITRSPLRAMYEPLLELGRLLFRTRDVPAPALAAARAILVEQSPHLAVAEAAPMQTLVARSIGGAGENGLILALSTVFGALSLLLAAAGIYGVISHGVSQRVYEIGVRLAIGARPRDVAGMVLAQGVRLAAIGLAIGLAGAWAGSRLLESRLFGVTPTDAVTFAGVTLFLLAVAAVASVLPARRASQVDPLVATRAE